MAREYRVIQSLAATSVPVPQALALCANPAVIGAPFFVMSFAEGLAPRTPADIAGFTAAAREGLAILEGIHFRFVQGQTVGAGFDRIGSAVPELVRLGLDTLAAAPHPR